LPPESERAVAAIDERDLSDTALTKGVSQPSLVETPAPSFTRTTSAVSSNACGPKAALPTSSIVAGRTGIPGCAVTSIRASPGLPLQTNICMRGEPPSAGVCMFALFSPPKSWD
jgi:hypothetical protein